MSFALAPGIFLVLTGLAGLSFGLYALLRGGREQRGGIGPLSERGVHVVAGIRMTLASAASLVAGLYLFFSNGSLLLNWVCFGSVS